MSKRRLFSTGKSPSPPPWRPAQPEDNQRIMDFLCRKEWCRLTLINRLRESAENPGDPYLRGDRILLCEEQGRILHLLLFNRSGLILPAFTPSQWMPRHAETLRKILLPRLGELHSLTGLREYVEAAAPLLPPPSVTRQFALLTLTERPPPLPPPYDGLRSCRISPEDVDRVFPLEKGYQEEEVILPGRSRIAWAAVKAGYRRKINRQIYLFGSLDSRPVVQAGINARGRDWDQIGSVYTLPAWRGHGLATWLVTRLCRLRMDEQRRIALFVNLENQKAQAVYRRIGFQPAGWYTMAYF